VEHSAFSNPAFQNAIKVGHLSIDIAGIQAPYIMAIGWLFGSHVVTLNCPNNEEKLRKQHLLKDLKVKPDRVVIRPEERRYNDRIFPSAVHEECTKGQEETASHLQLTHLKGQSDDKRFTVNDALRSRQRPIKYIRKLDGMEVPYCRELDTPIACTVDDTQTRHHSTGSALVLEHRHCS
jgi:hypothetical protein